MSIKKVRWRLKITDHMKNVSFLVGKDGKIWYMSASETPLSLSNLVSDHAAELRFRLEDAFDADQAKKAVVDVLSVMWARNKADMPTVNIISG